MQSSIRLIATDVDGTLLSSDRILTELTLQAIRDVQDAGIRICVCSGRNHTEVKGLCADAKLDELAVINNGAGVVNWRTGEELYARRMKREQVRFILAALVEDARNHPGSTLSVAGTYDTHNLFEFCDEPMLKRQEVAFSKSGFTGERYYVYRDIDRWIEACAADTQRILYSLDASVHGVRIQTLLAPYDAVDITTGMPGKLEIVPKGVDKGYGMEQVCKLYNIELSDTMAIGDGANDIGMISRAGLGIAMGNSVSALLEFADAVTCANADDGFAKALYRFALNREQIWPK